MSFKIQRTAILDGDILAYTAAAWAQSAQVDEMGVTDRVTHEATRWMREAMAERMLIAFSCSRADNYRKVIWPDYKSHRDDKPSPPLLPHAVKVMKEAFPFMVIPHLEADDILGMLGSKATLKDGSVPVMVTIDKDLRQVPGWHYNPDKDDHPVRVTQEEGDRFFHKQWLMGDATDSIPGLWKWGPAKADKLLDALPHFALTGPVLEAYAHHPKGYPLEYAYQMAQCVRILRAGDYDSATGTIGLWYPPGHPISAKPAAPAEAPPVVPAENPEPAASAPANTTTKPKANKPKTTKSPKAPKKTKSTQTKA